MFKASNFNPNAGSSVSKIMNPGTHYGRIVQIKLETPPYKTDAYNVAITIEGIDRGDEFEGLAVDKTNPSLGHYRGQVATVSAGRYPFLIILTMVSKSCVMIKSSVGLTTLQNKWVY